MWWQWVSYDMTPAKWIKAAKEFEQKAAGGETGAAHCRQNTPISGLTRGTVVALGLQGKKPPLDDFRPGSPGAWCRVGCSDSVAGEWWA